MQSQAGNVTRIATAATAFEFLTTSLPFPLQPKPAFLEYDGRECQPFTKQGIYPGQPGSKYSIEKAGYWGGGVFSGRHLRLVELLKVIQWIVASSILWMDKIHFAPPKKPRNDDSPGNTNEHWPSMISKWCRIVSIHSMSSRFRIGTTKLAWSFVTSADGMSGKKDGSAICPF